MDFFYASGMALFSSAIAQWYLLRVRNKAAHLPLPRRRVGLLSAIMWAIGLLSLILMVFALALFGFDESALDRSESWMTIASGLFAYAAGKRIVASWDKTSSEIKA